ARLCGTLLEGSHQPRILLLVFDGDAPLLFRVLAAVGRGVAQRGAVGRLGGCAAGLDGFDDVERGVLAHDDVVPAGIERVAGLHGDPAVAVAAYHLQPADHAPTVQVAVVQPVFGEQVGLLVVEIGFGEELPGEEAGSLQALETGAGRATAFRITGRLPGRDEDRGGRRKPGGKTASGGVYSRSRHIDSPNRMTNLGGHSAGASSRTSRLPGTGRSPADARRC